MFYIIQEDAVSQQRRSDQSSQTQLVIENGQRLVQRLAGGYPEGQGDDEVEADKHSALKVVALAILDGVGDDQHAEGEGDSLEGLEAKSHGLVEHGPAEDDEERRDQQSDLDARADGDAHGQVHLVAHSHDAGRHVLGGVADDGDEDEADEVLAKVAGGDDGVDAVDQVVGAHRDEHCHDDEDEHGRDDREVVLVRVVDVVRVVVMVVVMVGRRRRRRLLGRAVTALDVTVVAGVGGG